MDKYCPDGERCQSSGCSGIICHRFDVFSTSNIHTYPTCPHCAAKDAEIAAIIEEREKLRDTVLEFACLEQELNKEIARLRGRVERAEYRLEADGYRERCDIPACNCGDQWAHGGYAHQRLREISDALEGRDNGATILAAVEQLMRDERALRDALADMLAQCRCDCGHPHCNRCAETQYVERILRGEGE